MPGEVPFIWCFGVLEAGTCSGVAHGDPTEEARHRFLYLRVAIMTRLLVKMELQAFEIAWNFTELK